MMPPEFPPIYSKNPARNRSERSLSHLRQAIQADSVTQSDDGSVVIASAPAARRASPESICNEMVTLRQELLKWADDLQIRISNPISTLVLGLCDDRRIYENYLKAESMDALTGSLGATHPVRLVSVVLTDPAALRQTTPATIAAHEAIHQLCLITKLCPGWDAWPRWLHEGVAMLGDHTPARSSKVARGTFASLNKERLKDWRNIAERFDLKAFMQRDLLRDKFNHQADYAACWALTHGLSTWQKGEELAAFLNYLELQTFQPEHEPWSPIEIRSSAWLTSQFGSRWESFANHVKSLDL